MFRFLLVSSLCFAADPSIGFERWYQPGPQTLVPGYGVIMQVMPSWSVTFTCSSTDSTCYSPDYTPDGNEQFAPSDTPPSGSTIPGGIQTQPKGGGPAWIPLYTPVNIGTNGNAPGHFNLARYSRSANVIETSSLLTAGTPNTTSVPLCLDGTWPSSKIYTNAGGTQIVASSYGLNFSGGGAALQARFQVVTSGFPAASITSITQIDGGGNYTVPPTNATFSCVNSSNNKQDYALTFTGGTFSRYQAISSDGSVKMFIRSGGHGIAGIYIKDPGGTVSNGWPAGTTMNYWTYNGGVCMWYLATPPSNGSVWPTAGWGYQPGCVEVTIPATTPPGTFTAGWTACPTSTVATDPNCVSMTKTFTVIGPSTYVYPVVAPASIPSMATTAPNYAQQPAPCTLGPGGAQNSPGDPAHDCSFFTLLTSTQQNGYSNWFPSTKRTATSPNDVDHVFELNTPSHPICWSNTCQTGNPEGSWYYDGPKIYHRIALWSGDSSWDNVARGILARYIQAGPGTPGWPPNKIQPFYAYDTLGTLPWARNAMERTFSPGIAMGVSFLNGGKYSTTFVSHWDAGAVGGLYASWINVANNASLTPNSPAGGTACGGASCQPVPAIGNDSARYGAYQLDTNNELRRLGLPLTVCVPGNCNGALTQFGLAARVAIESVRSFALSALNSATPSGPYDTPTLGDQHWQLALIAESLIGHYELTKDPLDPFLIRTVLEQVRPLYFGTPGSTTPPHGFPYYTAPEGVWCPGDARISPGTGWYAYYDGANGTYGCSNATGAYTAYAGVAGGFLAAQYAWWWAHFGGSDNTYALFADQLAMDGISSESCCNIAFRFNPKAANEQYGRFGFDYFRCRQGRC
jgi:hypothetical protein